MTKKDVTIRKAAGLALFALFLWSCADTFTKLAGQTGAPKILIITLSTLSGSLVLFSWLLVQKKIARIRPQKWSLHALNLIFILSTGVSGVVAYTLLPLTTVYVFLFMAPMLIALFAAVFLGEALTKTKALCILVGFIGVLIALDPWGMVLTPENGWGYIASLLFLLAFTGLSLMMRIMRRTEQAESITFFGFFLRGLCFFPLFLWYYEPLSWIQIIYSCGIGVFAVAGNLCMTKAYHQASSAVVAPFQYFQIMYGAILGYFIFGDRPTMMLVLGVIVIVGSGIALLHLSKVKAKKGDVLPASV